MGQGVSYGGLPFLGTGCADLLMKWLMWDSVSAFIHLPSMYLSTVDLFRETYKMVDQYVLSELS